MVPPAHPPAVVVLLSGGLGNQLFQWGAAFEIAREFGASLTLATSVVDRPRDRGLQIADLVEYDALERPSAASARMWSTAAAVLPRRAVGALKRLAGTPRSAEPVRRTWHEAHRLVGAGSSVRLVGFFQEADLLYSDRERVVGIVRSRLFAGRAPDAGDYAAVHIRRGDYVSNAAFARRYGVCSADYYRQAITRLDPHLPVRLVSDDAGWAREFAATIPSRGAGIVVSGTGDQYDDLRTLASARQLVLSNSTFSWWGAFLSAATTVVCPDPWFTVPGPLLVRPEWIRIDRDGTARKLDP